MDVPFSRFRSHDGINAPPSSKSEIQERTAEQSDDVAVPEDIMEAVRCAPQECGEANRGRVRSSAS